LGGIVFLVNPDEFGSLDHTTTNKFTNSQQEKATKPSLNNLDLDNS